MDAPTPRTASAIAAAFLIVVGGLALNLLQAEAVGMNWTMPADVVDAIPVVLSQQYFHHPDAHTGLVQVRDLFGENLRNHVVVTVDDCTHHVLTHRRLVDEPTGYAAADPGMVDFVATAFRWFGPQCASVLWLYWLLLAVPGAVFGARFVRQPAALGVLLAFYLTHAALLPVVAADPATGSILAGRYLAALGMLPTLHLILEALSAQRLRWWSVAAVFAQTLVLVATLHFCPAALWQVACVATASVMGGVGLLWQRPSRFWPALGHALLPAVAVLGGVGMLGMPRYVEAAGPPELSMTALSQLVHWQTIVPLVALAAWGGAALRSGLRVVVPALLVFVAGSLLPLWAGQAAAAVVLLAVAVLANVLGLAAATIGTLAARQFWQRRPQREAPSVPEPPRRKVTLQRLSVSVPARLTPAVQRLPSDEEVA